MAPLPADSLNSPPPLTFLRWVAGVVARWRLVVSATLVVLALAALSLVLVPPKYRSKASFVANTSTASKLTGALAASGGMLGGFASQLGLTATIDPSESPNFYQKLLHSRELMSRLLLSRFEDPRPNRHSDSATLLEILQIRGRDPQAKLERGVKRFETELGAWFDPKTNIVEVQLDTRWPELSAKAVNRAVELVGAFNREQRSVTAHSKRMYLGDRAAEARAALQRAEGDLRSFHEQNRLWRTSPSLVAEEQQRRRAVDITSDLYLTLLREYDSSRLEELNSAALITVLDSAIAARKPQWPRFGSLFGTALMLGGFLGIMLAGVAAVLDDWRQRNPDGARSFSAALTQARREMGSTIRRRRERARPRQAA